jgi:hypothetical protein
VNQTHSNCDGASKFFRDEATGERRQRFSKDRLLKQVTEGKMKGEIEVTRRCKKLLDDLKYRRGYSHLKAEALDRTMRRNCFGGGFGPVVRLITE